MNKIRMIFNVSGSGGYSPMRRAARLAARYEHLNWALADQAMVSGANFLTGILIARYLGLEEFGRFTLAWMALLLVNSIQHALVIAPMMSIGPQQPAVGKKAYFGAVMVQEFAIAALLSVVILIGLSASAALFPEWGTAGFVLPLTAAALAFQFQEFLRRYFFVRSWARIAFANDAIRYFGQLIVLAWAVQLAEMNAAGALWVIAATASVAAVCGLFFIETPAWSREVLGVTVERHWRFSKWMAGATLLQWTSRHIFVLAAGPLLGVTAVGAIRAAQNLISVTHVYFFGLENVLPVRAGSLYHRDGMPGLLRYLKLVTWAGGSVTVAITILFVATPEFWLRVVYGNEFADYSALVRWFAATSLVSFLGIPLLAGLRALERTRALFVACAVATAAAAAAVYPFLAWFGIIGAAAGMLLVQVVAQGVLLQQFLHVVRRSKRR